MKEHTVEKPFFKSPNLHWWQQILFLHIIGSKHVSSSHNRLLQSYYFVSHEFIGFLEMLCLGGLLGINLHWNKQF